MKKRAHIFPDGFIKNLDAMYTLALQLTRNVVHAERLVHQTVKNAFDSLDEFDLETDLRQWLLSKERQTHRELFFLAINS